MAAEKQIVLNSQIVRKGIKLVPPDGGWGWMVLLGTSMANLFNQSMLSVFSLLYGDVLREMGHDTAGAAIVLSTALFTSNFSGPIGGALINLTSPRIVAISGSVLCFLGILLSGFSTNIGHLICTFGVLLGVGLGFVQNSTFVAINGYFKVRKSRAVGWSNIGTGVGQTVMPHLVRLLLEAYGFKGACIVLSGLSLNGFAGVFLLQPVAWHMKQVEVNIEDEEKTLLEHKLKATIITKDDAKNAAPKKTLMKRAYDLFDLSLLKSPRFLNVILGLALAMASVQNFSLIYPFFLQNYAKMDKPQTALCMSLIAIGDISGRLLLPILEDKFHIKARWMIIMSGFWMITARQSMANQTNVNVLMATAYLYGFGRSVLIVCRNLAVNENCRMEEVPAAVGLSMFTMGIIIPPAGYLIAWIRDYTHSYLICIYVQNGLLLIVLATWIPDMICLWRSGRIQKKKEQDIPLA